MAVHGVLHVRTFGIDLQFLAIEVEDVVDDFRLLEAKVLAGAVDDVALGIAELHLEGVEVGRLGRPLQRVDEVLRQRELHLVGLSVEGGGLALHRGHLLALGIQHLRFYDEVAQLCCPLVATCGGRQFEVGIAVVLVKVGGDVPVQQACLRSGIDIDIVEDACQTPVVLSFEVEAVTVFDHEHRKLVAPLLEVGGDVVLGRLLCSLVVAHLVSVHPKERCRGNLLEAQEDLLALPAGRKGERGAVGARRIVVARHVGRIGLEGGGDVAEHRVAESLHLPVRGHFDAGPLRVGELLFEEVGGDALGCRGQAELPLSVQELVVLGDVVGTALLLVELEDVQVLDVVIQMVHEVVFIGSCRVAGREPPCRSKP